MRYKVWLLVCSSAVSVYFHVSNLSSPFVTIVVSAGCTVQLNDSENPRKINYEKLILIYTKNRQLNTACGKVKVDTKVLVPIQT